MRQAFNFAPPIRGIIFDYGGTIDTGGCHWGKVLWHAYERRQISVDEAQFREAYVHGERTLARVPLVRSDHTFRTVLETKLRVEMEYLCTAGYWSADKDMLDASVRAVADDVYQRNLAIISRNKTLLSALKDIYPMVLVSNFYGNLHTVLHEFGLDQMFSAVVESAVVGIRKPDVRIFRLGVEALGLKPEEVLSVGDSFYKDIEPSRAIGCRTAWLKGEGWTPQVYDERIPDLVLTDLGDLLQPEQPEKQ